MEPPLISVITPSYNQAKFMRALIDSVAEQEYPNLEHIVVDGGSTDGTIELLEDREDDYQLRWISEPDDGIPDAVNKGLKMADGEWVGFQSADDYYLPGAFSKYQDILESSSPDIVYGDQLFVDADDHVIGLRVHTRPSRFLQKHWHHFASYHTILIRRELLAEMGGFDERYKYIHDGELFWRLLTTDRDLSFVHVPDFLAARRKHDENISTTHGDIEQYQWEQDTLYEYSQVEELLPNGVLFPTAIILKTLLLLSTGNIAGLYNMYLDLFNNSIYNAGYDGRIWFPDKGVVKDSAVDYRF